MSSPKDVGRVMGVMMLVQGVLTPLVYAVWLRPATGPGFLENASRSGFQIRGALVLSLALPVLTFSAAIAALPVFRRHSERFAFAYLGIGAIGISTMAMESVATRNLLIISQEYAKAGVATGLLRSLAVMARSTWTGAHFTNLIVGHGTVFLLFLILLRFSFVPRVLAAFGMAASVLSTAAVIMPLLGYPFTFTLIVPIAMSTLALMLWLLVKGLEERRQPSSDSTRRAELARA